MIDISTLRCTACGYELRGLERKGMCPECGLRIRRSAAKWRLRKRPTSWHAAVGLGVFAAGYALVNVLVVLMMLALSPFVVLEAWPISVFIAPGIAIVTAIGARLAGVRAQWGATLLFSGAMCVIGFFNLMLVVMCANGG